MSRRVMIEVTCDVCGVRCAEDVAKGYDELRVTWCGKELVIEACPSCDLKSVVLGDLLSRGRNGKHDEKKKPVPSPVGPVIVGAGSWTEAFRLDDGRYGCPTCEHTGNAASGVGFHYSNRHGGRLRDQAVFDHELGYWIPTP